MKHKLFAAVCIALLAIGIGGCRSRQFTNVGNDSQGNSYGVPANSIDGYAKAHGVSREEAARQMRAKLVPPSDAETTATQSSAAGTAVR